MFIFAILNSNFEQRSDYSNESIFNVIQRKDKKTKPIVEQELPNIKIKQTFNYVQVSDLKFEQIDSLVQSDQIYESPRDDTNRFENLFDPRLRKKLIESQEFNLSRSLDAPQTWAESDGRTFIKAGDGSCLASMQRMDFAGPWHKLGNDVLR